MTEDTATNGHRPTIRDVAGRAGVSKSLVSLVMRGEPMVREDKRRRVLQVAEELGYRTNFAARSLSSVRSKTVGVLIADLRNPLLVDVVERAEQVLDDAGLNILMTAAAVPSPTAPGRRLNLNAIGALHDLRIEAILVVGSLPDGAVLAEIVGDVPMVVAAADAAGLRADVVRNNDHLGMRLVVDYLVAGGHRHIAHLGGLGGGVARDRAGGYQAAMRQHGLDAEVVIADADFSEDAGYRGTAQLLRQGRPVTAIAALNDLAAVGAMSAAVDSGIKVPDGLAVTGYDDTFIAAVSQMSLTSVNPDSAGIGALAARCILQRISDPGRAPQEHLLPPRLVVRSSAAASSRRPTAAGRPHRSASPER